jgi:TRAP-type C4-dicarboxylate transport system substrate-binding protein
MDGKRSLAIGAFVAMTAAITACGGAAPAQSGTITKVGGNATTTLKVTLATVNDPDLELEFANSVNKLSAGAIDVTVTGQWRSGDPNSEAGLVNDVVGGKAELGFIGARGFDTVGVNSFVGLQAPMLIDSYDLEAKVLATDWATKLLDGPRPMGIVGLGYVQGELRQPLGISRNLAQVSDFQGARIGIRPSHVTEMTMKALGATTATYQDPTGLDGIEMGAPGVAGNKYDQGARSFTGNMVFSARPNVIFANAKWFDSLSAEQQTQLRAAAAEVDQLSVTRVRNDARDATDMLCKRGFTIIAASQEAIDAFHRKLQPVTDAMAKDPATKATIDAIVALRGPVDAPDVVAPCPQTAASVLPSSAPTAIDGVWKTSFTKADLIASPLVGSGEVNDGNWGDITFTFERGRVSYVQSNQLEQSSSSGTFTITGDAITMAFEQGANAGETFGYRWSIFKNSLTFKRDDTLGLASPTPFLIKSWTRTP